MEATPEETPKDNAENIIPAKNVVERTAPAALDPARRNRREDRNKKDDKTLEQFMKSLNSIPTVEEKLSVVCKKYVQSTDENKKMQFYIKQSDKRYALLLKEKEQLQQEFNKAILLKSKLENLCRELQKQNKAIKEESLLKIKEEEERSKETQSKFQNTLTEFTSLLQQNSEKNAKLRDDNISMTEKFKSVVTQYQLREQQVDKMAKQMALEGQLADAKLQKASLEHQADRERLSAEMEHMKVNLAQYRAKIAELHETETNLRSQLAVYTDKYDEFQNALVKSNQVFGGFKEQMEKMSKKIKKLEKESLTWKQRWESSKTALIDTCADKQAADERHARQLHHMQSLCRTLQAERTVLLGTLKEHNIERPPLPAPTLDPLPAPLPIPPPEPKGEKVEALKQRLSQIQDQLKILRETPPPAQEEPPKAEKSKKSKSKKNKDKKTGATKKDSPKPETAEDVKTDEKPDDITDEKTDVKPVEAKSNNDLEVKPDIASLADKVDEKTIESLIQAISVASNDLSDVEVAKSDDSSTVSPSHQAETKAPVAEVTSSPIEAPNTVVTTNLAETASSTTEAASSITEASNLPEVASNLPEVESKLPKEVSTISESASKINEVASNLPEVANASELASNTPEVLTNGVEKAETGNVDEVKTI